MSKATIVVFIVDGDFGSLYVTTSDKFNNILDKHNITSDRVDYKTIALETIMLLLDGKLEYVLRM
ncbi:hypothetical protein ES705_14364 [subsurface metagenome]